MSRTAAMAAMVLLLAGCASEPAAAPPTPNTPTATVEASVATTVAEVPDSTTTTTTTTTTTVPACELGDALDAVWLVDTGDGHGTAFHVGDGDWITAAHVVGDLDTVLLRHGSDEIEASVVGIDHGTDVVLLDAATESPDLAFVQTASGVGSDVLAAGYPLYGESEPSVTRGVISRLERDAVLGELVLTDTAVNPGNSGGPLFTECGDVAGMVVQKIVGTDVEGVAYAVTSAELRSQMPRLADGYGSEPNEPAADPEPALDDVPPLPDGWELLWTEEDLMTGSAFPFIMAWAIEYEHGDDGFYYAPSIMMSCVGDWNLRWGGALAFGDIDGWIWADYRIGDSDVKISLWVDSPSDYQMMTLWEGTEAARDMERQARAASPDDTLAIRAWDYQDDRIGTAVFPLKDFYDRWQDLWHECH